MAKILGTTTNIKTAMNMMDEGVNPVISWHGNKYVLSSKYRALGVLLYTKFGKEAIHSVRIPFSYAHNIGELLQRGEGLREKLPPEITEIP